MYPPAVVGRYPDRVAAPFTFQLITMAAGGTVVCMKRLDAAARLPLLSTYLGHVHPAATYWYLSGAPELFALVAKRLEAILGELP